MVSSTTETQGQEAVDGGIADKSAVQSSIGVEGIPAGRYRIVGLSLDTTGRLLTDEICQIAGHTRASSYAQYVMPYKNLSPPAKKKHKIRIVTVGKFRMLKSIKTNKVIMKTFAADRDLFHPIELAPHCFPRKTEISENQFCKTSYYRWQYFIYVNS